MSWQNIWPQHYDLILKFIDHTINEQFLQERYRDMILVDESPEKLLQKFSEYQAPTASPWISESLGAEI